MHEGLLSTLRAARARLNAAIVAYRAFSWAAPSAIAAGLLVALLRAAGLGTPAFPLWGGLVILGAAAGAAKAWKSRIDESEAARWLDERIGGEEILSAALACLGRGSAGLFDEQIIREAELLAPRASSLRASPRPLARRAAVAALACAIGAYAVFVSAPNGNMAAKAREAAPAGGRIAAASAKAADGAFARDGGKTASAFASSFFPDDKRLATLAERAILEGRLDDLRDMLRSADREYGSKIARALGEAERERLTRDRERIREAADAIATGAGSAGEAGMQGRKGDESGGGDEGVGAPGGAGARASVGMADAYPGYDRNGSGGSGVGPRGRMGANGRSPSASLGSASFGEMEDGQADEGQGGGAQGTGSGGSNAGSGSGSDAYWGNVQAEAGKAKALLETTKSASLFDLPLPGRESSAALSRLIPDSRKSAESAMARRGVPLEYEDFVRSYFMALSKGDSR